jgi:PAS domain S-box-containing protein
VRKELEKEMLIKGIDAFKRRLIVVSPEFKILAANRETDGMKHSEISGKYCYEVFYDRSSPCENCAVEASMGKGTPTLMPKPEDSLDLNEMPCYYAYPIFSGDEIEAFVSMDFDIPTRGGLEEKVQWTNAFLRNLIRNSVDGLIAADKKGKVLIFNKSAEKVFGYTEEEALNFVNIQDIYPDKTEYEVMQKLRSEDYGGKGKLRGYNVNILHKNGEKIPINLNASIIYENDREVATIGFFHDLREELRMRDELAKTQAQLIQAEKMSSVGKLAAGVAHQLNNPLGGITLFTKLVMEEYNLEEGAKEDLSRVLKDAERCRDIIRELLEFSRQTRDLKQPLNINNKITRTLFLLENQAIFQNITVEKDLQSSLPLVMADSQQLNHMLMNIILNAVQAMEEKGRLTVKSYLVAENDKVRIEITDTGPGIPEDIVSHIFEPFFTTKEEGEGTGLGLSLAYSIVENHGGNIGVKSKPEEGTTFIIDLPHTAKRSKGDESGDETG